MPTPSDLPVILDLLDSASASARRALVASLEAWGPALPERVRSLGSTPPEQLAALDAMLLPTRRRWLRDAWPEWQTEADPNTRVERGLALLSRFLSGFQRESRLPARLDGLARGFTEDVPADHHTAVDLARYLFAFRKLRGVPEPRYLHPDASDLAHTIEAGEGLPISLSMVYVLVGRRLGFDVEGCGFPGHFLAIARPPRGEPVLVDGYHGGAILDRATVERLQREHRGLLGFADILAMRTGPEAVIQRVLRNLARAFQAQESTADVNLMVELEETITPEAMRFVPRPPPGEDVDGRRRYDVGHVVEHRRYGYRGLVVHVDDRCRADELWYRQNRYQPDRRQPWYHMLVHEAPTVTYAAQSSLRADKSDEPVEHPLVDSFFHQLRPGLYIRNDHPWPGEL